MNISSGSSGSSSSCCEGEEEVVSHLRSSSFYRNVNSVSSPDPGYRYPTKKDNAAPPASTSGALDYRREEDCAGGQEQQDESEKEPIHSDSCCSSNRPGCCDSSVFARQDQLYQQLQELRLQFLADLWDILGKFKVRLDDHFDDAAVRFLIQQHIDILQRMIAPMVAQKEMLASWLTDRIIHQLRRQVVRYLDTFKGEKFQVSFDRLITRTVSGTPVCLAHSKADHDYERATTNLATSPACDHEQHEVETGQNPLKRKTSSSHTLAPGTSIRPVVAAYGVVNHEENEENHCKSWIQAYSEKSSCKRNRLRRLKSTEGTIEDVEVDYESEEREL